MIGRFRRLSKRVPGSEAGFTLVELLVVVGVIVALAAVIVPSVVKFSGKGDTGAQAAEGENVQAAMDTMLADKGHHHRDRPEHRGQLHPALDFPSHGHRDGAADRLPARRYNRILLLL